MSAPIWCRSRGCRQGRRDAVSSEPAEVVDDSCERDWAAGVDAAEDVVLVDDGLVGPVEGPLGALDLAA